MAKKQKPRRQPRSAAKTLSQRALEDLEEKQQEKRERIAPRDAAAAANRYYNELTGAGERATIEEIEFDEVKGQWIVTLAFFNQLAFGVKNYRQFHVNAYTGEVLSMKLRRL